MIGDVELVTCAGPKTGAAWLGALSAASDPMTAVPSAAAMSKRFKIVPPMCV